MNPKNTPEATEDPATQTPEILVANLLALHQKRLDLAAQIAAQEQALIAIGAGTYVSTDGQSKLQVIGAVEGKAGEVSYGPPATVDLARKFAGDAFGKLFTRTEVFTPCEGFALIVPKLVTPAKAAKLLVLFEVTGKATSGKRAHVKGYPKPKEEDGKE